MTANEKRDEAQRLQAYGGERVTSSLGVPNDRSGGPAGAAPGHGESPGAPVPASVLAGETPTPNGTFTLTRKQRFILELVSEGQMTKQVARMCGVSEETVKWHLTQLRRRYGARNTTHLVAMFVRWKRAAVSPEGEA